MGENVRPPTLEYAVPQGSEAAWLQMAINASFALGPLAVVASCLPLFYVGFGVRLVLVSVACTAPLLLFPRHWQTRWPFACAVGIPLMLATWWCWQAPWRAGPDELWWMRLPGLWMLGGYATIWSGKWASARVSPATRRASPALLSAAVFIGLASITAVVGWLDLPGRAAFAWSRAELDAEAQRVLASGQGWETPRKIGAFEWHSAHTDGRSVVFVSAERMSGNYSVGLCYSPYPSSRGQHLAGQWRTWWGFLVPRRGEPWPARFFPQPPGTTLPFDEQ